MCFFLKKHFISSAILNKFLCDLRIMKFDKSSTLRSICLLVLNNFYEVNFSIFPKMLKQIILSYIYRNISNKYLWLMICFYFLLFIIIIFFLTILLFLNRFFLFLHTLLLFFIFYLFLWFHIWILLIFFLNWLRLFLIILHFLCHICIFTDCHI